MRNGTLKRLRIRAFVEQGGLCFYCERALAKKWTRATPKKDRITADHLVPVSRGGKSFSHNIVAACMGCNSCKGNLSLSELMFWLLIIERNA